LLFPLPPLFAMLAPLSAPFLFPIALYSAYCAGVLAHNQNHCPVFPRKATNAVYAGWLSIFYGFPIFAWIPTHNQNHHRHLNGKGDAARTTRVHDTVTGAALYSLRAGFWQAAFIAHYLVELGRRRPLALVAPAVQLAMVLGGHAVALALFLAFHEPVVAVMAYAATIGVPALVGPPLLQLTNYLQHVGCNPTSPDNHSRNFVSPVFNWFVFDNGFHTVHHENPGTHWSRYRALHGARQATIDPELNQWTPIRFVARRYFGALRAGAVFRTPYR
jgi:fatty acid desaturase